VHLKKIQAFVSFLLLAAVVVFSGFVPGDTVNLDPELGQVDGDPERGQVDADPERGQVD